MGIYIKGMEMPTNCWEDDCPCLNKQYGFCQADDDKGFVYSNKPEWCPLVPVPKHGRLVDADALIIALETQDYSCAPDTLEEWTPMDMTIAEIEDIRNAPTIIEGDEHE